MLLSKVNPSTPQAARHQDELYPISVGSAEIHICALHPRRKQRGIAGARMQTIMTLKTRRFLFWGLLCVFVVIGTGVVLYSEGWRLNIGTCSFKKVSDCQIKFEKTGAIFIQTRPKNVVIKVDNKIFQDKSGLIQSGTLVANLIPKMYRVEISKKGYLAWRKDLEVNPQLVTEANNIILIPQAIKSELVQIPKLRGQKLETISSDDKRLIVKNTKTGIYYLYDLTNPATAFNINLNLNNTANTSEVVKKVLNHPFDANKLIIETNRGLYILDTLRLTLETALTAPPMIWTVQGANIYYLRKTKDPDSGIVSFLIASWNLVIKNENPIFTLPKNLSSEPTLKKMGISPTENRIAFLDNLNDLYLFNQSDGKLKNIARNIIDFDFSLDGRKIAFWSTNGNLYVLFLDDWQSDNPKSAGDLVQFSLGALPLKIKWYKDSYHLFIGHQDKLEFKEIDDRTPVNEYPLLQEVGDNFFYNTNSNLLYFLKATTLYRLTIPS